MQTDFLKLSITIPTSLNSWPPVQKSKTCACAKTWLCSFNLTFIRWKPLFLLLFALLTYFQVEKVRNLNLEASTSYKLRTASIFLKFAHFEFRRLSYKTQVDRRIVRLNSLLGNGGILKQGEQQWNSLNPYLREFFRRETRAVLAKRRAKALSHVARDSNVTLLWSEVERGWGRGRVAQVVSRTSFLDFRGTNFHCVVWTEWFTVARIIGHERRRWKDRLDSLIQVMILRGCTWLLLKCWRHKVDWLIWVALSFLINWKANSFRARAHWTNFCLFCEKNCHKLPQTSAPGDFYIYQILSKFTKLQRRRHPASERDKFLSGLKFAWFEGNCQWRKFDLYF